jgi:hypothetical protein
VVEDRRDRQPDPGRGSEPVPQLHRGQRIEPDIGERTRGLDADATLMTQHGCGLGQDNFQEQGVSIGVG